MQGGLAPGFDFASDTLVSVVDTMNHRARVHAQRGDEAALRIKAFNDAKMARHALGNVEEVMRTVAHGSPVQMCVIYPAGFGAKKEHALLHSIHGGPHAAAGDTFHYRWNTPVFAAQGHAAACVSHHGSRGFGCAFLDSITPHWGELELQDVEAGSDWLLAPPRADKRRLHASGRQLRQLHGGLAERTRPDSIKAEQGEGSQGRSRASMSWPGPKIRPTHPAAEPTRARRPC